LEGVFKSAPRSSSPKIVNCPAGAWNATRCFVWPSLGTTERTFQPVVIVKSRRRWYIGRSSHSLRAGGRGGPDRVVLLHSPRRRSQVVLAPALDWMAVAAEEHGREILEVYLQAMRGGDWRAAEALMSRIYGKPTETVVTHTPASPAKAVLKSMTLEKKLELLHSLRRGELADATARLPVVELVPPSA
jgi:hypothetical protein